MIQIMKNKVLSLSYKFSGTMFPTVDTYSACVADNGYKIVHHHEAYGNVIGEKIYVVLLSLMRNSQMLLTNIISLHGADGVSAQWLQTTIIFVFS